MPSAPPSRPKPDCFTPPKARRVGDDPAVGEYRSVDGGVELGVREDQERRVAAQLH